MERCDNCGKTNECTSCKLCGKKNYCSERCEQEAFTEHQIECNAHDVPKGCGVMHKYEYEDLDEKNTTPPQSHLLRTVNPNGSVGRRIVTPETYAKGNRDLLIRNLGRGDKPNVKEFGNRFRVTIWGSSSVEGIESATMYPLFSFTGSMDENVIYADSDNKDARQLYNARKKRNEGKYLFWVPGANIDPTLTLNPDGGYLKIMLETLSGENVTSSTTMKMSYPKPQLKGLGFILKRSRRLLEKVQSEFSIKEIKPGITAAFRGKDYLSQEVRILYNTIGAAGAPKAIVDIELLIPEVQLRSQKYRTEEYGETVQFSCNPLDINQVTGLTMALEEHLGQLAESINFMDVREAKDAEAYYNEVAQNLSVIDQHREELERNPDMDEVSGKINAAVYKATQHLWQAQQVGLRLKGGYKDKYRDKISRGGGSAAIELAEELRDKMVAARASGVGANKAKKLLASAKKGMIRKRLEDLQTVIFSQRGRASDAEKEKYDQALEIIDEAMNPANK